MSRKARGRNRKTWVLELRGKGVVIVEDLVEFCSKKDIEANTLRKNWYRAKPGIPRFHKGVRILGIVESLVFTKETEKR